MPLEELAWLRQGTGEFLAVRRDKDQCDWVSGGWWTEYGAMKKGFAAMTTRKGERINGNCLDFHWIASGLNRSQGYLFRALSAHIIAGEMSWLGLRRDKFNCTLLLTVTVSRLSIVAVRFWMRVIKADSPRVWVLLLREDDFRYANFGSSTCKCLDERRGSCASFYSRLNWNYRLCFVVNCEDTREKPHYNNVVACVQCLIYLKYHLQEKI